MYQFVFPFVDQRCKYGYIRFFLDLFCTQYILIFINYACDIEALFCIKSNVIYVVIIVANLYNKKFHVFRF